MNKLFKALFGTGISHAPIAVGKTEEDSEIVYPIAVVQYARDEYGVGTEEHLHWALIVLVDNELQRGPCFQVFEPDDSKALSDRSPSWELFHENVKLDFHGDQCLGGVIVGYVRQNELLNLQRIALRNKPHVKFDGWNCRSWVMEVIQEMIEIGWVDPSVRHQSSLLPSMKQASLQTVALRTPMTVSLTKDRGDNTTQCT
ncbi:hypothetical protein C8Q75DRAFT_790029 [Abortiporus biennis]|nr:hypothetical protein C8Q75DRAFT_790029 [Abortiporus biennis]